MMEDRFTYKQKKIGIFILFVLVLMLGYKRVIKNTIRETSRYLKNKTIKKNEEEIRKSILQIQNEIHNLDNYLGEERVKEPLIQQEILEFITSKTYSDKITVTYIKPTHSYFVGNYSIISNSFTIKGSYNSLISLIYQIERDFKKSKLNNAKFFTQRNYKFKKEELFVELLFQNFNHNQ